MATTGTALALPPALLQSPPPLLPTPMLLAPAASSPALPSLSAVSLTETTVCYLDPNNLVPGFYTNVLPAGHCDGPATTAAVSGSGTSTGAASSSTQGGMAAAEFVPLAGAFAAVAFAL